MIPIETTEELKNSCDKQKITIVDVWESTLLILWEQNISI